MRMLHKKRSQVSMLDLFIGAFLFLSLITLVLITWNSYNNRLNERLVYEQIELKAFQVSDLLVRSPGSPTGWENNISSLKVIGLATKDRILSKNKVEAFVNLSNNDVTKILNLENYNFYFKLGTYESGLTQNGTITISLKRKVIFENETETMQFTLWQ